MPVVSPITITPDTLAIVMTPAGGNGNGSMSYRSDDQDQTAVIVPKVGDGKSVPDRADARLNMRFLITDPLDASRMVAREAFARVNCTLPPSRDIPVAQVQAALRDLIMSDQFAGVLSGESFWG